MLFCKDKFAILLVRKEICDKGILQFNIIVKRSTFRHTFEKKVIHGKAIFDVFKF